MPLTLAKLAGEAVIVIRAALSRETADGKKATNPKSSAEIPSVVIQSADRGSVVLPFMIDTLSSGPSDQSRQVIEISDALDCILERLERYGHRMAAGMDQHVR
jgi:hypothetical protein